MFSIAFPVTASLNVGHCLMMNALNGERCGRNRLVLHQCTSLSFTWRDGDILNLQVGRTCYPETSVRSQQTMCNNAEERRYQILEKFVKKFGLWKNSWIGIFFHINNNNNNNNNTLPPWLSSFDLFRHRRIAIVSCGVRGLFFLEVCS